MELMYDGFARLVEPYKLEFGVRKKDGRGLEYFWAYNLSGRRSEPGIRRFICDKIEYVRPTSRSFAPRNAIEL